MISGILLLLCLGKDGEKILNILNMQMKNLNSKRKQNIMFEI